MRALQAKPQARLLCRHQMICSGFVLSLESVRELCDRNILQLVGIYYWRNAEELRNPKHAAHLNSTARHKEEKRIAICFTGPLSSNTPIRWKHKKHVSLSIDSRDPTRPPQLIELSGVPLHTTVATWRILTLMDVLVHVRGIIFSQQPSKDSKGVRLQRCD